MKTQVLLIRWVLVEQSIIKDKKHFEERSKSLFLILICPDVLFNRVAYKLDIDVIPIVKWSILIPIESSMIKLKLVNNLVITIRL